MEAGIGRDSFARLDAQHESPTRRSRDAPEHAEPDAVVSAINASLVELTPRNLNAFEDPRFFSLMTADWRELRIRLGVI